MADLSNRITTSSEAAGKSTSSSLIPGNGNLNNAGGMEQVTVVRIGDVHVKEEESDVQEKVKEDTYYEMEYSVPTEDEVVVEGEDDGVYVIEYSNPEEEGESYQFTMSVPAKDGIVKRPVIRTNARPPATSRVKHEASQEGSLGAEVEEEMVSNKSVLELGEDYSDVMEMNSGDGQLRCPMCPPPSRVFKRASGLAVHLKQLHRLEGKKTFFCTYCSQTVRTQIELDAHTKRHANQEAVFTCSLCSAETAYKGSKQGLKKHLAQEHPGVIPRCDICNKNFKTIMAYLADQFRHVGVSPYYCAKCQIYEMTMRGLSVHIKNHNKKTKKQQEAAGGRAPAGGVPADNSATDDSDF
ncbi:telomere zinc finger-associated protein [Parambassis ranga]|uniref:Telomere zinc finger-associated protein n=1 Tax=Parambassis ranga TaxID=210632 RepID=A0A6P7KEV3_9TELE|nr:telomere zinc finger-associated protein-like [Parambassis ranga]